MLLIISDSMYGFYWSGACFWWVSLVCCWLVVGFFGLLVGSGGFYWSGAGFWWVSLAWSLVLYQNSPLIRSLPPQVNR